MDITKQIITTKITNSDVRFTSDRNYVVLTIKDKVVNYCHERDAYGNVIPESSIEPRNTNIIYLPLWKIREAMLLDMKGFILLKSCGGTINSDTIMGLINATVEITIVPYKERDRFIARDGREQEHASDGADIFISIKQIDDVWRQAAAVKHSQRENPYKGLCDVFETLQNENIDC